MPKRTHGRGKDASGTYNIWKMMRRRCNSPACKSYPDYGARGIRVCARWDSFEAFLGDVGERPSGMTLERIDNNGPYSSENCKWLPKREQRINTRGTHRITYKGVTKPLSYWARDIGVSPEALKYRLAKHGIEKAMTTPVNEQKVRAGKASIKAQGKDAMIKRSIKVWRDNGRLPLTPICQTKRRNLHPTKLKDDKNETG